MKQREVKTLLMMMAVMQFTGCGVATSKELVSMLSSGEQIEICVTLPEGEQELQGSPVEWKELSYLTDQEDLRKKIDDILGILVYGDSKNGVLYVNPETEKWEPNNTLEAVYKNKAYTEMMEDDDVKEEISKAVQEAYTDVDDTSDPTEVQLAAINAYFNIFPADEEKAEFNGNSYLTRAQFMTGLVKAHMQAQTDLKASAEATEQLGDSEYTAYEGLIDDKAYLDASSKSLNKSSFNGLITRAEVAYMLVKTYYEDELDSVDVEAKDSCYIDVKNAGNMAEDADTVGKEQYKAANLSYMLENTDKGLDEDLYKAMVVAYNHKLFGNSEESRWNEPITKVEALKAIVGIYEEAGTTIKCQNGMNQEVDISDASLDDMTDLRLRTYDTYYNINGKEYLFRDLENIGSAIIAQEYGCLPPITFKEWDKERHSRVDGDKLGMYDDHVEVDLDGLSEAEKMLTKWQLIWLNDVRTALDAGMTEKQQILDSGMLDSDRIDEALMNLYYGGLLSEVEKSDYEKIYNIKKPEVTYVAKSNTNVDNSVENVDNTDTAVSENVDSSVYVVDGTADAGSENVDNSGEGISLDPYLDTTTVRGSEGATYDCIAIGGLHQ